MTSMKKQKKAMRKIGIWVPREQYEWMSKLGNHKMSKFVVYAVRNEMSSFSRKEFELYIESLSTVD